MRPVRVKKTELLAAVKKNRDQHRAIFLEAVDGYKAEALRLLEEKVRLVKRSKLPAYVAISLYVPEDHTKDYDNAIAMFEMSVDEELEVDETSFNQLVRDDWQWKRQWLTSNSGYSVTAATFANQVGEDA
jgi:hypothetical protein